MNIELWLIGLLVVLVVFLAAGGSRVWISKYMRIRMDELEERLKRIEARLEEIHQLFQQRYPSQPKHQ